MQWSMGCFQKSQNANVQRSHHDEIQNDCEDVFKMMRNALHDKKMVKQVFNVNDPTNDVYNVDYMLNMLEKTVAKKCTHNTIHSEHSSWVFVPNQSLTYRDDDRRLIRYEFRWF